MAWDESEQKGGRKERKRLQQKDRSKFKKSDAKKTLKREIKPGELRGRVLSLVPNGALVSHEGEEYICILKGSLKKERTRLKNLLAVGDFVHFAIKEDVGSITHIEERYSHLARESHLNKRNKQLIAVNIDQVLITASLFLPPLKPFLLDRYIIASQMGGMQPVVCINKIDLLENPPEVCNTAEVENERALFNELVLAYEKLDIPCLFISAETGEGVEELKAMMWEKTSVFSGQSGVGKSTLINAVLGTKRPTKNVILKTRKGAHTTTRAELIPLENGGFCIDTPGIRSFGVWNLKQNEVRNFFPEILTYGEGCKFKSCTHTHEPECSVKLAVEEGNIATLRYDSYCALMESKVPAEWE